MAMENWLFLREFLIKTSIQFGDFPASHVWWHQKVPQWWLACAKMLPTGWFGQWLRKMACGPKSRSVTFVPCHYFTISHVHVNRTTWLLSNPLFQLVSPLEVSTFGVCYFSLFEFELGLLKNNRKTIVDFRGSRTLLIKTPKANWFIIRVLDNWLPVFL